MAFRLLQNGEENEFRWRTGNDGVRTRRETWWVENIFSCFSYNPNRNMVGVCIVFEHEVSEIETEHIVYISEGSSSYWNKFL